MRVYDEFCTAVLSAVLSATRQEKAAIRQELTEHLEDHAAYLMETQGLSDGDAAEAAVDAMGDAAEIGRELDKKYSHAWQILEVCTLFALVMLVIVTFFPSLISLTDAYNNYQNITEARHGAGYVAENVEVCDIRIPVKAQVLMLHGTERHADQSVTLHFYLYSRYPWLPAAGGTLPEHLQFYAGTGPVLPSNIVDSRCYINSYGLDDTPCVESFKIAVYGVGQEDTLTMVYDYRGYAFSEEIPLTLRTEDLLLYTKGGLFP